MRHARLPLAFLAVLFLVAAAALVWGPRVPDAPPAPRAVPLTGWTYVADPRDEGLARGWARRPPPGGRRVALPHVANAGAVAGAAGERAHAGGIGWYFRSVRAAREGEHALRFDSAHHRARVWVDGRRAGTHLGAYEPFTVRPRWDAGDHLVAVRVDWRDPRGQAEAGWPRGWFNWGGLNGRATLTRVGRAELSDPAVETRLTEDRAARVTVRVRVRRAGGPPGPPQPVVVDGRLAGRSLPFAAVRLRPGERATATATVTLRRLALWSPGAPALHDLRLAVDGGAPLSRRVGLRELRWEGGELRLNGRPLVLRGAGLPPGLVERGDALRPADADRLVAQLRAIGANATRSQHPLGQEVLERLDAAGILVWQEAGPWEPAGAWRADTAPELRAATERALRTVAAQRAHPSIVAWTLVNEVAGQGHPGGQAGWVAATARRVRELDPGRPVAADVWGRAPPRTRGPLYAALDAIGVTDYVGWYELAQAPPAAQEAAARERLEALRALFPDKVLVVTEVGAEADARNPAAAPGGLGFQADLLGRRLATYRSVPGLDGALVWNLRDYPLRPSFAGGSIAGRFPGREPTPGLNAKGLFTADGRPKPAARAVARHFGGG